MSSFAEQILLAGLPFLNQYINWWEKLPSQWRFTAFAVVVLALITGLVYVVFVMKAPFGHEDDRGFHPEESQPKLPFRDEP